MFGKAACAIRCITMQFFADTVIAVSDTDPEGRFSPILATPRKFAVILMEMFQTIVDSMVLQTIRQHY